MKLKRSVIFTPFLTVSLLFIFVFTASSCVVMEDPDAYRMMFFQARMSNTSALQLFNYTPSLYASYTPDPDGADRVRNGKEWQNTTGNDVVLEDILAIQYDTKPELIINAYQHNSIKNTFGDNAFMQVLSKPSNKALLEYLVFSKQVEATEMEWNGHESWNQDPDETAKTTKEKSNCLNIAKKRLSAVKTDFLRKRYAFQICRLAYQLQNYPMAIKTYESYFKKFKGNDLMNVWAALFYAQSLDATKKHPRANYFYSLVFDNCDSKKLRTHELFHTDEKTFEAGLKLAKTPHEKAIMQVMRIINNPGPALKELKIITELEPKSSYLSFLTAREINKLEDWICTPFFTPNNPSISPQWNFDIIKAKNRENDLAYLQQFKNYLTRQQQQSRGELRQYLTLGLAHLCFLSDSTKEGLNYLNAMGLTENSSIETQKNIEKAWVMTKTDNVTGDNFKDQFVIYCRKLQRLTGNDININKVLYTLLLGVAHEYENRNDYATAGLLSMKAEQFKIRYDTTFYENYQSSLKDDYEKISYFDLNAGIGDVENLIKLISKSDKSDFEQFICDQHLGSLDFYRDLQGTIAFRQNDLKTAYQSFKQIDGNFWHTHYKYNSCLNEDPFFPKVLAKKRSFGYQFDKARFVKRLMDLQEKTKKKSGNADVCLQLGNAYFNCSYFGNSWMMVKYGWSSGENYTSVSDSLGYSQLPVSRSNDALLVENNYYNCKIAEQYYRQALDDPKATTEQKAMACLMLHECHYNSWSFSNYAYPRYKAGSELIELYSHYTDTKIYKDYKCPLLDEFISRK